MKMFPKRRPLTLTLLLAAMAWSGPTRAQDAKPAPAQQPNASSIEAINADYRRELQKLERQRLERLNELAASQPKAQAEITYQEYFQLAIAKGLYTEAEPVAERMIEAVGTSPNLLTLANVVNIIAEAERGAYDDSLKSLVEAVSERRRQAKPPGEPGHNRGLLAASRAAIVDAYYQRLIRGDQYDVAHKAMKLVAENAETPAIRDLAERRIRQLQMIGLPAPPIVGIDLDGKPFRLEDAKGEVVLVLFWATWCLPTAQEIPWLEEVYQTYHDKGFRIVGIDVDTSQDGNGDPKALIPNVRRFLLEFNVPWTTLINGQGDQDLTRSYSVAEIPANVLIGRDGKVIHLDLVGPKLDKAVGEAVSRKP